VAVDGLEAKSGAVDIQRKQMAGAVAEGLQVESQSRERV
jgi:hypothetical protein